MIPLLLPLVLASAGFAGEPARTVWVRESVVPLDNHCPPRPSTQPPLPVGLRAEAVDPHLSCPGDWLLLRVGEGRSSNRRPQTFYVSAGDVSDSPPKPAWANAKAIATVFVRQAGDTPAEGYPLDDPNWVSPVFLSKGETVEVLDPSRRVIRTSTGRELLIDPFFLDDQDPTGTGSQAQVESAGVRRRFHAGRPAREAEASMSTVPASVELVKLAKAGKGIPYLLNLRPEWLSDPRHGPDFFDPIGHVLDHDCGDKVKPWEPCGRYVLDYTAFGAWWPTREVEVVALADGTEVVGGTPLPRLKVVVMDPWGDNIAVSPAWDGVDPGK